MVMGDRVCVCGFDAPSIIIVIIAGINFFDKNCEKIAEKLQKYDE